MSLKNLLTKDNGWALMGNACAAGIGFLTLMALARYLSAESFGQWALFIASAGLADMLRMGMLRPATVKLLSSAKEESKAAIIGSAWALNVVFSLLLALAALAWGMICEAFGANDPIALFSQFYPLLVLVAAPLHFSTWLAHAQGKFRLMTLIRLAVSMLFLGIVLAASLIGLSLYQLVVCFVMVHVLVSLLCLLSGRAGFSTMRRASRTELSALYQFGKHSMVSLLGSNLLKSTDTLMIGALMGPAAAGMYALPMRLLEAIELPLRSISMTLFPKLSRLFAQGREQEARQSFMAHSLWLSIGLLPIILILFWQAPQLLAAIGGPGFEEAAPVLRIFCVYLTMLPLDRCLGVFLDASNRPAANARKVWLMVLCNAIGNTLAFTLFGTLSAFAMVTVLNVSVGLALGFSALGRSQLRDFRLQIKQQLRPSLSI